MRTLDLTRLPELVRSKAEAMGDVGQAWLASLPDRVATLEQRWSMSTSEVLSGGSEALVMAAQVDGRQAVLKLGLPQANGLRHEARVLALARGRGYAELFAGDDDLNAILVERLGQPLGACGFSERDQIERLCSTAQAAWLSIEGDSGFTTGAGKARWLREFIATAITQQPGAISDAVSSRATDYAQIREAAWSPATSVLVHGDVHAFNTLQDARAVDRYKLVDPDGYFMEPEYDLGLIMRDFHADLRQGDPLDEGRKRCRRLAGATGLDEEAIWQWGFIERVTTGLYLLQLGVIDEGLAFLSIAEEWVD